MFSFHYDWAWNWRRTPTMPTDFPPELFSYIFENLSPRDLARVCCVSKKWHDAHRDYYHHVFYRLLGRFFPLHAEINAFRALQAAHGILISGSSVIQFFQDDFLPDSDLDVYAEHRHGRVVGEFLLSIGFTFVPRDTQKETGKTGFLELFDGVARKLEVHRPQYDFRGIADVYDFYRNGQKVQLITAKGTPIEIILSFHCTAPMNFISYDKAYSLYPRATFVKKEALNITTNGSGQELGRQKYADRGWKLKDFVTSYNATTPKSEFSTVLRWIGDSKTLVVPLQPLNTNPAVHLAFQAHSWKVEFDKNNKAVLDFELTHTDSFSYCVHKDVAGLPKLLNTEPMKTVQRRLGFSDDAILDFLATRYYSQLQKMYPDAATEWFNQPEALNWLVMEILQISL